MGWDGQVQWGGMDKCSGVGWTSAVGWDGQVQWGGMDTCSGVGWISAVGSICSDSELRDKNTCRGTNREYMYGRYIANTCMKDMGCKKNRTQYNHAVKNTKSTVHVQCSHSAKQYTL